MSPDALRAVEELKAWNQMAKLTLKGFIHLPLEDAQQAHELFERRSAELRARIAGRRDSQKQCLPKA